MSQFNVRNGSSTKMMRRLCMGKRGVGKMRGERFGIGFSHTRDD